MAKSFEETEIWKISRELAKRVHKLTNLPQCRKDYGLVDQVRSSVVSILSNIAEGFERGSNAELLLFLYRAKGSAGELRAHMYVTLGQSILRKPISNRFINDV